MQKIIFTLFITLFSLNIQAQCTFNNPIVPGNYPDPWILQHDGWYYWCKQDFGSDITVERFRSLPGMSQGEGWSRVFSSGNNIYEAVWAPELHFLNGKWYIFSSGDADPAPGLQNLRMFVLESDNWNGPYTFKGLVNTQDFRSEWCIDPNILVHPTTGKTYMSWSQWEGGMQCIYIGELDPNNYTRLLNAVKLSQPQYDWEKKPNNDMVNEGPEFLIKNNKVHIAYSASQCHSRYYSLGLLTADINSNLTNPASWAKSNVPVFSEGPGAWGPGHNCFVKSPDMTEDWIVYHAHTGGAWENAVERGDRAMFAQSFTWNGDYPSFGPPKTGGPYNCPSTSGGIQSPYTGTAYPIPGIIEAENFDKGGEGVAYHDNEAGNLGGQYRTSEGVDIQVCTEGGYDLGWAVAGEWQEYSVNVLATGTYKVAARVACGTQLPGSFHIEFDGVNTSGTINGVATGDWQNWTTVNDTFNLTAGTHIMRVYYEKSDINVNNFTFTNLSSTGTGNGLTGNYFNGMNFETPVFLRRDNAINFNWDLGSPDASVNVDQFSARWTGQIQAKYTDTYTFYLNSDNGRRLWINGQLIIDKWIGDWGTEYTGTIILKAGQKYDIKLEYFEENGGANCKLEWSSPTQAREVVPKNQLYANQAPTVSISAPTNNAVYTAPASVTITANAIDADGTISKVEFYNGTTLLNSDNAAPYTYTWTNVGTGTYTITAKAYDNANAITISTAVTIQVNAANQLPIVSITAPTNNMTYTAPASIAITANATDSDGTVSKVEFYNGTTLLNSDNAAPYTYTWTNVGTGTYTITAKAYDNVNASIISTAITVHVNALVNQLPTVSIAAPTNNAVYTSPASVTITANASDADGSISKVEFYNGTTLLNSENTAPYSYNWTNVAAGAYTITAKAYDNSNAVTTSSAIAIQVNAPANQFPTVSITAPTNNAVYTSPASVTITVNTSDADGSINKVEFYNGTTLLNSDNAAPYTYNWPNVGTGTYTITAKAYDNANSSTTSSAITVQVNAPANQLPTISITEPNNNAVYTAPTSVTITANANDADGSISKVEFYNGITLLGTVNSEPYSFNWTNVGVGDYMITAKAYDNTNLVTTSSTIEIVVDASVPTSISSASNAMGIIAAPIPFQTTTTISMSVFDEIQNIVIYNTIGQQVQCIDNISANEVIIGNELSDGMYLVYITTTKGTTAVKVLKGN